MYSSSSFTFFSMACSTSIWNHRNCGREKKQRPSDVAESLWKLSPRSNCTLHCQVDCFRFTKSICKCASSSGQHFCLFRATAQLSRRVWAALWILNKQWKQWTWSFKSIQSTLRGLTATSESLRGHAWISVRCRLWLKRNVHFHNTLWMISSQPIKYFKVCGSYCSMISTTTSTKSLYVDG